MSYEITTLAVIGLAVIGGLLFGVGAALNNGCGVSTISKLARGQIAMLATIMGWLVGWLMLTNFVPKPQLTHFQILAEWHYGGLFIFSIVILIFMTRLKKPDRKIWAAMLVIGIMASIAFLYEPKWTPSGLLKDISLSLWHSDTGRWPAIERFMLISALVSGMAIAALWTRSFKLVFSGLQQNQWVN